MRRVSGEATVGVIANPASGRDIRRLVAGALVFGNADKAGMVFRLLAGLGAAGVGRVLMLPAADGLSVTLHRHLHARHTVPAFAAATCCASCSSRVAMRASSTSAEPRM